MASYDMVHGWTGPLDFFLKKKGPDDVNPVAIPLAGMTVTLILKDNQGATIDVTGDIAIVAPDTDGKVRYTPDATDLDSTKSPYSARWKITDAGGANVFCPSVDADMWTVRAQ